MAKNSANQRLETIVRDFRTAIRGRRTGELKRELQHKLQILVEDGDARKVHLENQLSHRLFLATSPILQAMYKLDIFKMQSDCILDYAPLRQEDRAGTSNLPILRPSQPRAPVSSLCLRRYQSTLRVSSHRSLNTPSVQSGQTATSAGHHTHYLTMECVSGLRSGPNRRRWK